MAGRCDHPIDSNLFLVVTAVTAGADGPADSEDARIEQQNGLEQFVALLAGISANDTVGRVQALIQPSPLQAALLS